MSGDHIVSVNADEEVVSESASLSEKLDMSVMKKICNHVYVNSYQGTFCRVDSLDKTLSRPTADMGSGLEHI